MSLERKKSIEIKLIDELANPEIIGLSKDISEIALDSILDEGLLRDFPVIGAGIGVFKTYNNIREKLFAKKILIFLLSLNKISTSEREDFLKKLNKNERQKQKIGETLIMLLERMDNMEKPTILGNLVGSYIKEDISYEELSSLGSIVNNAHLEDLKRLRDKDKLPIDTQERLAFSGLMNLGIMDQPSLINTDNTSSYLFYVQNKLARKLIKFGLT